MLNVKIYHNPRCSKSRATLALLEERGLEPEVILYLKNPPEVSEIKEILTDLDMEPADLIRKGEKPYCELNLANADPETIIQAMADHPILLERPIVRTTKGARIGRPPETVLEVLDV